MISFSSKVLNSEPKFNRGPTITKPHEYDVLVIGAGGAGLRAAIAEASAARESKSG